MRGMRLNDLPASLPGHARTLSIIDSSKPFSANPSFLHLEGVRNQSPFPVHVPVEINIRETMIRCI